ncbi:MAG: hypothetical protein Q4B47_00060 [Eubacteriales bacterium]|nr:hypothetical protein [Eubacteriales bacterium]
MKKRILAIIAASTMLVSAPVYAASLGLDFAVDVSLKEESGEQAIQANATATIGIDSSNKTIHIVAEGSGMGENLSVDIYGQADGDQLTLYGSLDGEEWVKTTEDAAQLAPAFELDLSTPLDLSSVIDLTETADGYKHYSKDFTLEEIYTLLDTLGLPQLDQLKDAGIDQMLPMLSDITLTLNVATNEADDTFAQFYLTLNNSDFTTLNALLSAAGTELIYNNAEISIENLADDSTIEIPAEIIEKAVEEDLELPSLS